MRSTNSGGLGLAAALMLLGCSRPLPDDDGADSQDVPDLPDPATDLPPEDNEVVGILYGLNFGGSPTRFIECESGEVWHMSYVGAIQDPIWKGSCYGVYNRVRGHVDVSGDPPVVVIEEILEARWCEPSDCDGTCVPDYDSCHLENDLTEVGNCDPLATTSVPGCDDISKCNPVPFYATEVAGWGIDRCITRLGDAVEGEPCEYPADPGYVDTCIHGQRCWNPEGDLTEPGVCVAYCDLTGEIGPACDGTCVPCSGSDRGLCMHGCSGDDCNVDAFC